MRRDRPVKRSLAIAGHRTSITLETVFWEALKQHASVEGRTLSDLVAEIDDSRGEAGLSSAIRVYLFQRALRS